MNSSNFVEGLEKVVTAATQFVALARHVMSWRTQLTFAVTHALTLLGKSGDLMAILRSREKLGQYFTAACVLVLIIKAFVEAPSAMMTAAGAALVIVLVTDFARIEFFTMGAMRSAELEDRFKRGATDEFKRLTEAAARERREGKVDGDRPRGKESRALGRRRKPESCSDVGRTGMRLTQRYLLDMGAPRKN
jgi:hypothetical protein